jgi:hypothetical protein
LQSCEILRNPRHPTLLPRAKSIPAPLELTIVVATPAARRPTGSQAHHRGDAKTRAAAGTNARGLTRKASCTLDPSASPQDLDSSWQALTMTAAARRPGELLLPPRAPRVGPASSTFGRGPSKVLPQPRAPRTGRRAPRPGELFPRPRRHTGLASSATMICKMTSATPIAHLVER